MSFRFLSWVLCLFLAAGSIAFAQTEPAAVEAEEPVIEEYALTLLKQMSAYLKDAKEFTFEASTFYDVILDDGQKLRYNANGDVSIRRPNRFQLDFQGYVHDKRMFCDGKNTVIFDNDTGYYVTNKAASSIDAGVDRFAEKFGFVPPLSDILISDIYKRVSKMIQSGFYVGHTELKGTKVHHLAFRNEDIDWQIWIEDGKKPLPRMYVITYKNIEGSPQYTAVLSNWDFYPQLADSFFTFIPPEGAEQIEFLTGDNPFLKRLEEIRKEHKTE